MSIETIKVNDTIPDGVLDYVEYNPEESLLACPRPIPFNIHERLKGKKAVIFAIPGPFTPACSETHVPDFVNLTDALKKKGVQTIVCFSVVDGFVMNAFGKSYGVKDKIIMAGDGNATFAKALGLTQDLTNNHMGVRSKRFAIIVDDLVVKYIGVDSSGVEKSSAEAVLAKL